MSAQALPRQRMDDRTRIMVTPEGIAVPLVLASRAARLGALVIDLVLIGIVMLVTTIALAFAAGGVANLAGRSGGSGMGNALEFLFILWIAAMFLFRNAWFLYFELGPRGATPGKRLTGMRIAARDGGRLSAEMVIARNLLRDIELFLPLVFLASASNGGDMGAAGFAALAWFLIFGLFVCFNRDRLRAGDLIAGTWVVEAPKRQLEAALSIVPAQAAGSHAFTDAELDVYGEYELQTLERLLRENRGDALAAVAGTIAAKIGRTAPDGTERPFLDAYYAQLRARLEARMRMGQRKASKFS